MTYINSAEYLDLVQSSSRNCLINNDLTEAMKFDLSDLFESEAVKFN